MENASKALIIAGAILLAIIIISLGIMVVNNARSQIGTGNLDATNLQAFNTQWDMYIGDKVTASQVAALCSAAIANNAAEEKTTGRYVAVVGGNTGKLVIAGDDSSQLWIAGKNGVDGVKTLTPVLPNLYTYTVQCTKYKDGYVQRIEVTKN